MIHIPDLSGFISPFQILEDDLDNITALGQSALKNDPAVRLRCLQFLEIHAGNIEVYKVFEEAFGEGQTFCIHFDDGSALTLPLYFKKALSHASSYFKNLFEGSFKIESDPLLHEIAKNDLEILLALVFPKAFPKPVLPEDFQSSWKLARLASFLHLTLESFDLDKHLCQFFRNGPPELKQFIDDHYDEIEMTGLAGYLDVKRFEEESLRPISYACLGKGELSRVIKNAPKCLIYLYPLDLQGCRLISQCSRVQALSISTLAKEDLSHILSMSQLESLRIMNSLSHTEAAYLARMTRLTELTATDMDPELFECMPQLEHLTLDSLKLKTSSQKLPSLKALHIRDASEISEEGYATFQKSQNLFSLMIANGTFLTDRVFQDYSCLQKLTILDIKKSYFQGRTLHFPQLSVLSLKDTPFFTFKALNRHRNVRGLQISEGDIPSLSKFQSRYLNHLSLSHCTFPHTVISDLKRFPNLKAIHLESVIYTQEHTEALRDLLKTAHIKSVSGTPKETIEEFKSQFPDIQFH